MTSFRLANNGRSFLRGRFEPSSSPSTIPTASVGEMTSTVTVALLVPSGKVSSNSSVMSCEPTASTLVATRFVPSDQKYLKVVSSGSYDLEPSNTTVALVLSGAITVRLVEPGKVASGDTWITGTGGLFPGKTMTLKLQWLALPAASMAEQVTTFVPRPKADPESGVQAGIPTPGQLSEFVGLNVT